MQKWVILPWVTQYRAVPRDSRASEITTSRDTRGRHQAISPVCRSVAVEFTCSPSRFMLYSSHVLLGTVGVYECLYVFPFVRLRVFAYFFGKF